MFIFSDWSQFLPTIIATAIGVYAAFKLTEWQEKRIERRQARKFLSLLKKDIEFNYRILSDLRGYLQDPNFVPFYNFDRVVWSSILSSTVTVLEKPEIMDSASKFYFQLQHVGRKVDMLFKIGFSSDLKKGKQKREILVKSINNHISSIFEGGICSSPQKLISDINCLIRELK